MSKLVCKYSGCHDGKDGKPKGYNVYSSDIRKKPWMEMGCCYEHYKGFQNEIAISRNESLPYPDYVAQMIKDGVIADDTNKEDENIENDILVD